MQFVSSVQIRYSAKAGLAQLVEQNLKALFLIYSVKIITSGDE